MLLTCKEVSECLSDVVLEFLKILAISVIVPYKHKRRGRKNIGGRPDTKPIVCQHFCLTRGKNLPKRG